MSEETAMKAQGFNVLFDETKSDLQWGRSGLMATAAFLEKNPNTALVVAAATLEAQQKMWTDAETAAKEFVDVLPERIKDGWYQLPGDTEYYGPYWIGYPPPAWYEYASTGPNPGANLDFPAPGGPDTTSSSPPSAPLIGGTTPVP
jgi:ABC-type nitrate/sulfonate/bicarbonate transport system substrate-binding protein